jgi:6-phosphogluconolactonase
MRLENRELKVLPNTAALMRCAAELIAGHGRACVEKNGIFRLVISGGNTPKPLFLLLARLSKNDFPWDRTHFFWSDERHVPPEHPESNYRMAAETLLREAPIPPAQVHRIPTGNEAPEADARAYEDVLRAHFGLPFGGSPHFDLTLLGLGEDGHTASLFPGSGVLKKDVRWVVASESPAGVRKRITLTLPALNASQLVVFLVSGEAKADILREVLKGSGPPALAPAKLIRPEGRLIFLADAAAASKST